jgi:hypothetical protein
MTINPYWDEETLVRIDFEAGLFTDPDGTDAWMVEVEIEVAEEWEYIEP